MNCDEANNISILDFLNSLGFQPVRASGNSYWYLSPLRNEKTPSFKVDAKLNRWYDHGTSNGGKLVDLGTKLLSLEVSEFLSKLSQNDLKSFSFQKHEVVDNSKIEIRKVKALENKALTSYLEERSVSLSVAKEFCKEIYYKINDKNYFAISFENDSKGFEIRNRYFKACLGSKDISTIVNKGSEKVILFEGFMDFLSAFKQPSITVIQSHFIVLNSVNQVEKAKARIQELNPTSIEAYFDNDDAGRRCFEDLKKDYPLSKDRSNLYKDSKDVNEMISRKKSIDYGLSM